MTHKKSSSTVPLGPMPSEILAALKLAYKAGVSDRHVVSLLGINRQTYFKLIGDDGRGLYQSRVVELIKSSFSLTAIQALIQAHEELVKAEANFAAALNQSSTHNNSL